MERRVLITKLMANAFRSPDDLRRDDPRTERLSLSVIEFLSVDGKEEEEKKKERYEGEKERRKMIIVRLRTENHAARANDGRRHDKREIESFAIASFIANLFTKRDQLHLAQDIFLAQVSPFIFRCSRVAKSTAHG